MSADLQHQWEVEAIVEECGDVVRLLAFEGTVDFDDPELVITITPLRRRAPGRRQWGDP